MIFVVDDDKIMRKCIARACGKGTELLEFGDAISAMDAIATGKIPNLILLDILLDGPDGFTLLNELVSYPDTAQIPIVIVTSLDLPIQDLSIYGVVGILKKDTMTPQEIHSYVQQYAP